MRNHAILAAGAACLLAGCAGGGAGYEPIIDGSRGAQYQADLASCQAIAQDRPLLDGNAKTQAAAGAALVGLLAGLDGEADGDRLGTAVGGALVGGALGGGAGALEGQEARSKIVKTCMSGRGYRVLG